MEPHIVLSGESLFHVGSFSVTNTLLTTWIVMAILILGSIIFSQTLKYIPGRGQVAVEGVIAGLFSTFSSMLGEKTRKFFPLLATFFLFIIVSSWFGLLPGVGTIGIKEEVVTNESYSLPAENTAVVTDEHAIVPEEVATEDHANEAVVADAHGEKPFDVPLLRAPTADLNTTLALSLIGMIMLQYWSIKALGSVNYIGKFITFKDPISFFIGILELVGELGRVLSFAFRLFGNIFAGEVLLVIIGSLIPFLVPIPFLGLEIFVGFIQALVFSMLLSVLLSIATSEAHH